MSVASRPSPMMFTPPKPNDGFRWVQHPAGGLLVCEALEPFAAHFFTTRGWRLGERDGGGEAGWSELADAAEVDITHVARLRQVHRADVVTYKKGGAGPGAAAIPQADIVVSDDPRLALAVQTADCLPVLLVDRRTGAVAAAHAGWRGLAARVPIVTVAGMAHEFGSNPSDVLAAIGPAIGSCCYEVGEDVRARFVEAGFGSDEIARWFVAAARPSPRNPSMPSLPLVTRSGRSFFDGWRCAREQLSSVGVPDHQIYSADLCTASHPGAFCSYRRDGSGAGRMAAVIRAGQEPGSRP